MNFREHFRFSNFQLSLEKSLVIASVAGSQGQTQFGIIPYISSAVLNKYLPMNTYVYKVHLLSMWAYIWFDQLGHPPRQKHLR